MGTPMYDPLSLHRHPSAAPHQSAHTHTAGLRLHAVVCDHFTVCGVLVTEPEVKYVANQPRVPLKYHGCRVHASTFSKGPSMTFTEPIRPEGRSTVSGTHLLT